MLSVVLDDFLTTDFYRFSQTIQAIVTRHCFRWYQLKCALIRLRERGIFRSREGRIILEGIHGPRTW